jgi:hypothetical protein
MLDLETMGKSNDAAIIAIGAVAFDLQIQAIGDKYYTVIDLESAVDAGGVMDPETILWWLQQSETARKAFAEPGKSIVETLRQFQKWASGQCVKKELKVWGNGANFDNVILASAYRRLGLLQPWFYYNDRCYRTVRNLYPAIPMQRTGIQHNAVDDAESQARHLMSLLPAN